MLKKLIGNVLKTRRRKQNPECQHHAVKLNIEHTAVENVIKRLLKEGYEAYLVGGAVRDLLLGIQPKDFDVATNATPEQVRDLFRRSRIIGRRFPIVHVMVGSETIEVSTFRSGQARQNEHGRIMKDNAYGTLAQDTVRRDFTCNALYYDIVNHIIIDYHNGVQDVHDKKLVIIGNPAERYQEDPVRILRAVRLSGKLGFSVDDATAKPIPEYAHLLKREPTSRLFDEILKILFSGNAQNCLKQLGELNIPQGSVHPLLDALQHASQNPDHNLISLTLQRTDQRLQANQSVSVGFILASLMWENVYRRWQNNIAHGQGYVVALNNAITQSRDELEHGWGVPQRYSATMREIWSWQPQFENRRGLRPYKLLSQPRFRASYDFLLLRAQTGEVAQDLADWWTTFQHANDATRQKMLQEQSKQPDANPAYKKRKRKRKPKNKADNQNLS